MIAIAKVGNQFINLAQITYTEWEENPRRMIVHFTNNDIIFLAAGYGAILDREMDDARNTHTKVQEAAFARAFAETA